MNKELMHVLEPFLPRIMCTCTPQNIFNIVKNTVVILHLKFINLLISFFKSERREKCQLLEIVGGDQNVYD